MKEFWDISTSMEAESGPKHIRNQLTAAIRVKIRRFYPEDITKCREIVTACLSEMAGMDEATKTTFAKRMQTDDFLDGLLSAHCVVAEINGIVVGMGALKGNEIQRMYCDPEQRGRHIGSTIYKHLEEIAKRVGIRQLQLESSLNAEGFYARLGFSKVRVHKWSNEGHSVQNVIMQKPLRKGT
jgi:GNAT superfamily N-acetyltransferase